MKRYLGAVLAVLGLVILLPQVFSQFPNQGWCAGGLLLLIGGLCVSLDGTGIRLYDPEDS